jgi:hypothetical protein
MFSDFFFCVEEVANKKSAPKNFDFFYSFSWLGGSQEERERRKEEERKREGRKRGE